MNYYKLHIGDYIRDTAHLSLLEHGVYTRLLQIYYLREGPLAPAETTARLVGARTSAECKAVTRVLEEFFRPEPHEGGFRHRRCDEELKAANEKAEANRENGKLGGRPKRNGSKLEPTNNHDGSFQEPKETFSTTPILQEESKNAADAATPILNGDPKKAIFDLGVSLLGEGKRGLIGKAVSRVGLPKVGEVLAYLAGHTVADPQSYFAKATTPKERGFVC